jgi:hypothetical protein
MNIKKIFLMTLSLFACVCGAKGSETKVFYTPLEIETYVPISRSNIVSASHYSFLLTPGYDMDRVLGILNSKVPGMAFDEKRIRILIELDYGVNSVYIDSNGCALQAGKKWVIDKKMVNELSGIFDRYCVKNK